MTERGREKFVRTYLRSREGSTLKSYQSGYKALGRICLDSIFRLLEEERCVTYAMAYKWLEMAKNKLDLEDGLT